jgi:hypothetical protein
MEEFTIYYGTPQGKDKKIGVDSSYPARIKKQKIQDGQILEVHTCVYEVSDREMELQRQYGVKVDTIPYYVTYFRNKSAEHRTKTSATLKGIKRNPSKENQSNAGKIGGSITAKARRKLTMDQAREIRILYATGQYTFKSLGKKYGVDFRLISKVVHRKTYKDE